MNPAFDNLSDNQLDQFIQELIAELETKAAELKAAKAEQYHRLNCR